MAAIALTMPAAGADVEGGARPSVAPTGRETPALATESELQKQLTETQRTVEKLQRDAYQANPKLERVETLLKQLLAKHAEGQQRRRLIDQHLERLAVDTPGLQTEYANLVANWRYVTQAAYLKDPERTELLKQFLAGDEGAREIAAEQLKTLVPNLPKVDWRQEDALWRAFSEHFPKAEGRFAAAFDARARRANFPKFVVDQAKKEGEWQLLQQLYGAYIYAHTPGQLRNMRHRLDVLKTELANEETTARTRVRTK